MKLNWTTKTEAIGSNGDEQVIHRSQLNSTSEQEIQQAVDTCIEKACELLESNIQDDSRYLLFGWGADTSTLTIVVTDDDKVKDARDVMQCQFVTGGKPLDPEDIQFWIKDYLTTCAPFLRYSLIAAFHRESRANCTLL